MDSKVYSSGTNLSIPIEYDDTVISDTSVVWSSTGTESYGTIKKVEFEEPSLQNIYDKIIKLLELVEDNTEQFSDDLEYVLRMRNRFVENRGYINVECMVKLNKLWKKYKND